MKLAPRKLHHVYAACVQKLSYSIQKFVATNSFFSQNNELLVYFPPSGPPVVVDKPIIEHVDTPTREKMINESYFMCNIVSLVCYWVMLPMWTIFLLPLLYRQAEGEHEAGAQLGPGQPEDRQRRVLRVWGQGQPGSPQARLAAQRKDCQVDVNMCYLRVE